MKRTFKIILNWSIPVVVVIVITVISCFGLIFGLQAKGNIDFLESKVSYLEKLTTPPNVSVLKDIMSIGGTELSISKLIIEELETNTLVRAEIENVSNQTKVYTINNRTATHTQEGFTEITIDSPYVVVPLTNTLQLNAGERKQIVILVSKLYSLAYVDSEAWIEVEEVTSAQVKYSLVLRILIKAN